MTQHPEVSTFLLELMKVHHVNAVGYAIVDHHEVVDSQVLSTHPEIKVSSRSLFQACSLSKILTAVALLHLCSIGRIDLDVPVNRQLREWKIGGAEAEQVTISQCLSMTSGLCYGDPRLTFPNYPHDAPVPRLMDILTGAAPAITPPIIMGKTPGSCYSYTGAGFMVLQQLIEERSGSSFSAMMQEKIFPGLGMKHSTFECPLRRWKEDALPGFNSAGEMNMGGWDNIPTSASGGMWSNPQDIAQCIIALSQAYLGKENSLLSKDLAVQMLQKQKGSDFGLGLVIDDESPSLNFRKNGRNAGFHNELIMFPTEGKGIIVMTNSAGGMPLIHEFIRYVARAYSWPSYDPEFDETRLNSNSNTKVCCATESVP